MFFNMMMNEIFDNFFEYLKDDSSVIDTNPIVCYKKEKDYIIEVKTLGIDKNDINVKLNGDILIVSGESKNKYNEKPFNANIKIRLDKGLLKDVENIDYTSNNGITYVFIRMKEIRSDGIKINKI